MSAKAELLTKGGVMPKESHGGQQSTQLRQKKEVNVEKLH